MFSAASRLIWGADDEVEEPPAHLLDCLDFVESSSEDENDCSDYFDQNTLDVCDAPIPQHQDVVSYNSEKLGVLSKSPATSPSPKESPDDTQKLFHRYARMYLKLIFQSSASESRDIVLINPVDTKIIQATC